jgi:hypothetical protein
MTREEYLLNKGYKIAELGYQLKVGDIIKTSHFLGVKYYTIIRTTKKYAIVKFNDIAEGRYPIVYGFGFHSLPYQSYDNNKYKIFIKPE